jgi:hypothetical protein
VNLLRRIRDALNRQLRDAQPARHRGDTEAPEESRWHASRHSWEMSQEETRPFTPPVRARARVGMPASMVDRIPRQPRGKADHWNVEI